MVPSVRMRRMTLEVWSQRTRLPAGSKAMPPSWERATSWAGTPERIFAAGERIDHYLGEERRGGEGEEER